MFNQHIEFETIIDRYGRDVWVFIEADLDETGRVIDASGSNEDGNECDSESDVAQINDAVAEYLARRKQ